MLTFDYQRAGSVADAIGRVTAEGARFYAGGTNLLDLMKLEIETPDASANTPEPAAGQSFCFCSRHIQLDPARSAALIEPAALLGALAAPG